jgi:hypothetical protein
MIAALLLSGSEAGGAGAWLAAIVGSLGSLAVALLLRRGLCRVPRPTEAQLAVLVRSLAYANPMFVPLEPTFDLYLLTDDQLAHAWRCSGLAVSSPTDRRALMRAIDERQRYLEELERRQPGLLGAWLAYQVDTPGDVLPVQKASRLERYSIDWDELTREESA